MGFMQVAGGAVAALAKTLRSKSVGVAFVGLDGLAGDEKVRFLPLWKLQTPLPPPPPPSLAPHLRMGAPCLSAGAHGTSESRHAMQRCAYLRSRCR